MFLGPNKAIKIINYYTKYICYESGYCFGYCSSKEMNEPLEFKI